MIGYHDNDLPTSKKQALDKIDKWYNQHSASFVEWDATICFQKLTRQSKNLMAK